MTVAVFGVVFVAACHGKAQVSCAAGMQSYDGHCLSDASVSYIECTKGRGFDFSSEVSGGLSGTFRVIVGASVTAAVKKSQREDTPVALQIVRDCLALAQQSTQVTAVRQAAQQYTAEVSQTLRDWQQAQVAQTPHITLDRSTAAIGETVTVTGTSFWPNETVDIRVHATLVAQVPADSKGDFTARVTVPESVPPPDFPTTITASGESSAKSAEAPFTRAG